ncbi:NAD(P)-binding domain-containing protein [Nonomuraea aridisoli]|uniref:NAD(P)-binding domain-containing protein n=1 Tax=Nonomuraea aridisoli TaxID=2070368 RepID=UPI001F35932A|nr:NAD(P)-binding domain-containing protein [Nonomuraea aridisoli]
MAESPSIAPYVRYRSRVAAISRLDVDRMRTAARDQAPFVIRLAGGDEIIAAAVIDASGTWTNPNVLGANGLPAHGDAEAAPWINHALPDVLGADRPKSAGKHTIIVGAGYSAATTLLALADLTEQEPGTRLTWAIRADAPDRAYGGEDDDALPARGTLGSGLRLLVDKGVVELAAGFKARAVRPLPGGTAAELVARRADGSEWAITADTIVAATGYRPDHSIVSELRLDLDPVLGTTRLLAPLIDPNDHSCGTVRPHGVDELTHPEPGYYAIGMKSYGRAPTFLMATGYEQARSVVAALAGDWEAARDVQLVLPETGVCSVTLAVRAIAADFGLPPDTPARLLAATSRHLSQHTSPADAVLAAAAELGVDPTAAFKLAALAGELRLRTSPSGDAPCPAR